MSGFATLDVIEGRKGIYFRVYPLFYCLKLWYDNDLGESMRILGKVSGTRFITVFYFLENGLVINKIVDSRNIKDITSKYTQMILSEGDNIACYDTHVDVLECNNFKRIGISENWDGEQFPYIVYCVDNKELWASNDRLLTESDKVILTLNGVTLYDYKNTRLC